MAKQNGEHKPTCNGVVKGRPGKGRVLSLGQRANCYNKPPHRMDEENTFRYTSKPTAKNKKPLERQWCKACRALSRKRSQVKRMAEAKARVAAQRKADKTELANAMPTATPKGKGEVTAHAHGKAAPERGKRKPTRAQQLTAQSVAKAKAAAPVNVIGCGQCAETFPDPVSASKHVRKAHKPTAARKAA
jgi:hypothetical protein